MKPGSIITVAVYTAYRCDHNTEECGKTQGGGTNVLIKQSWRYQGFIKILLSSLLRELRCIILRIIYTPPSANKDEALKELYNIVSKYENTYDDAAFIVLGDFNQCNLKTNLAKYEQYITFSTRDQNALDHCYSNIKKGIHCIPKSKPW